MKKVWLMLVTFLVMGSFSLNAQSLVGDWKISVPGQNGETLSAKLSIAADNTYKVDFGIDGTVEVEGKMTVEGNKLTIQDTGGSMGCKGENAKGIYSYTVDANSMTMTKISDACEGRGASGEMKFTKM